VSDGWPKGNEYVGSFTRVEGSGLCRFLVISGDRCAETTMRWGEMEDGFGSCAAVYGWLAERIQKDRAKSATTAGAGSVESGA